MVEKVNLNFLFLSFLLPCTLLAEEPQTTWTLPSNSTFLSIIPAPPTPGSPAEKADLDGVLAMQNHPTKPELEHAQKSVGYTVFTFAEVLGPDFNATTHPSTAEFFKRLESTVNTEKNFLKESYHRDRPFREFPLQVKELVTEEKGYSYPSGHATRSWLSALVLGTLDPKDRNAFLASAMQVSQDRVIGGMHYPSDVLEGRVLAEAVYADLMEDSSFKHDLEDLRSTEWATSERK